MKEVYQDNENGVLLKTISRFSIGVHVIPNFVNEEPLNMISYIGAVLVVVGSMTSSLVRGRVVPEIDMS